MLAGFIAVNDSLGVRRIQCVRDLDSQLQHLLQRQRLAGNAVLQGLSVEKLHRNEGLAFLFADFIDGANVGVVQGGSSLRLALEAGQRLSAAGNIVGQKFERNGTMKLGVRRFINHTHAAPTEFFEDAVMRDNLANHGLGLAQS